MGFPLPRRKGLYLTGTTHACFIPMEYERLLRDALSDWGDLELCFADGRTLCVHALKLSLASPVLRALMDDVLDDQIITAAKRRKALQLASYPA